MNWDNELNRIASTLYLIHFFLLSKIISVKDTISLKLFDLWFKSEILNNNFNRRELCLSMKINSSETYPKKFTQKGNDACILLKNSYSSVTKIGHT